MRHHNLLQAPLLRCLLLVAFLCRAEAVLAAPDAEPELVPATGEIRLDGKIRSISLDQNTFALDATSFTLPNGKTNPLALAKPKTILLSAQAVLYVRGDAERKVALAELKAGVFAIVIGKDTGSGENLPAREVAVWQSVEAGVFKLGTSAVTPLPVSVAPTRRELPLEQTLDGYTLRITDMRWIKLQDMTPNYPWPDPYVKVLAMKYDVQAADPNVQPQPGGTLKNYIRSVRLIGPSGERLLAQGAAWYVDPRWDKVTAEFEFQDPATPPEVAGPFEDTLEFKALPLPKQLNKPVVINRSITTKRGDRFIIEKAITRVVEQADGGMQGELAFSLAQQSTAGLVMSGLGVSASAEVRIIKLVDDNGTDLTATNLGDGAYPAGDNEFPGRMVLRIRPLPVQTGSLTVQLQVKDKPQRLPDKWYRHFRLDLNLPTIPEPALDKPYQPLATAKGKIADVTVENLLVNRSDGLASYAARLWIEDKKQSRVLDQQRDWIFRQAKVRWLRGGNELESDLTRPDPVRDATAESIYWKSNGTPLQPNETGKRLFIFASQESPTRFTFDLTLEAVRTLQHTFDFTGVPMPKAGEVLEPNLARIAPSGARLVLRAVGYFPDEASWLALDPARRGFVQPQLGLLAVFALERASGDANAGTNGEEATIVLHCSKVTDDRGRVVSQKPNLQAWFREGLSKEQPRGRNWGTFILAPPAPDSRSFNMQVEMDETVPTGEQETVVLPDIPVP